MRSALAAALGGLVTGLLLMAAGVVAAGTGAGADPRAVYREAAPAVVGVSAQGRGGSGFLIDDRHALTNAHVVGDATRVEVTVAGRRVAARVRGAEPSIDLAVLELAEPIEGVRPLAFGPSAGVGVGDPVVAIGAPFGLQGSLSSGIVSGLRRRIDAPNGFAITGALQTDAALNPGNSGGPLLDMSGRVVGIATQISTEGGRNEGVGFAIPSDAARPAAAAIVATGRAGLPYLGIAGADAGDGVLVGEVIGGGPSAGSVLSDDLVTAVDGVRVTTDAALAEALVGRRPGQTVTLTLRRAGRTLDVRVTLGERPARLPAAGP